MLTKRIIQSMLSPDISKPDRSISQSARSVLNQYSNIDRVFTSKIEEGPPLTVESCQSEADKDDACAKKGGGDDTIRKKKEGGEESIKQHVNFLHTSIVYTLLTLG